MKANQAALKLRDDTRGYAAAIGGIVALLISVLIIVMVYWKISTPVSDAMTAINVAHPGISHQVMNNTNNTANGVFTLAPIIAYVIIAGIILGIIMRFGVGSKQE